MKKGILVLVLVTALIGIVAVNPCISEMLKVRIAVCTANIVKKADNAMRQLMRLRHILMEEGSVTLIFLLASSSCSGLKIFVIFFNKTSVMFIIKAECGIV